ncbi:MAG TPA: membrane protein insertase YidC [Armatimonadota bacterium]|nr:membrane protein insertase YidC [Armatimonadota bacterium]
MNNKRLLWIAAIMWLAAILMMRQMQPQARKEIPQPAVMLARAQAQEKAAGNDAGKLKDAVKSYWQVAKTYRKTEYAAAARLRVGIIQETKLEKAGARGSKHAALTTYQALVRDFSGKKSEAAQEAQTRLKRLERRIDKQNSTHILYKTLDYFVKVTGSNSAYSYALALLVITIVFKMLTTPLSHLQFKYMREMQKIQPLVKQLQEKYKNNQKEFGPKLMALYKEHGVSPFGSCLPLLVQMPVLYLLYWMVRLYQFQFANGEFLWIGSGLASKFPSLVGTSLAQGDVPLLVLYTVSMFISQKLTVVDPTQAEQQKMMTYTMPLLFGFMLWKWALPSAFVLYWLFFNIISTVQQYLILKQPTGPAGPADGAAVGPPIEPPKRHPTSPGRARRRKKRFSAIRLPRPTVGAFPAASLQEQRTG